MQLKTFKPLWGFEGAIEQACLDAKQAGFQGIEGHLADVQTAQKWQALFQEQNCDFIAEIVTGNDYVPQRDWTVQQHLDDLQKQIEIALEAKPLFANCLAGLDAWPESEAISFFEQALRLQDEYGLSLSFETHRSRPTFTPWNTLRIAQAIPELNFTLDMSHWCVVCERLMDAEAKTLSLLIPQVKHIHARVGYDQGPQVPDPRAPEYRGAVQSHMNFWWQIWQYQQANGSAIITMTPEFGTDGYCHLQPYTQMPVVDIWEINCWMREQLVNEFTAMQLAMGVEKSLCRQF